MDVGGWNFLAISNLITDFGIPGQQIGHYVIIVLRTGHFHLTDFQARPINIEVLLNGRKMADRKIQDDKSRGSVDKCDFSDERILRCDDQFLVAGVRTRRGERSV